MKRVERSARIPAPPAEVFAFLSDLDRLAEWQSGVISAEGPTDGQMRVGATARVRRRVMGQEIEAPLTIVELDPPQRVVIESEVSGVRAMAELLLSPADGEETDLRFAMEIAGSGFTSFMEPMIASTAGSDIDASLERVRARFAAESD